MIVVAAALLSAAALASQQNSPSRVVDGGFETGFISLNLPSVELFPMVAGGWASRGDDVPQIVDDATLAFQGTRSIRLSSNPQATAHLIQDLPLTTAGFGLQFAFWIESGSQSLQIVSGWNRRVPVGERIALAVVMSATGLEIATLEGVWQLDRLLAPNAWHTLTIIADPRTGAHSVSLDGTNVLSLPGSPPVGPVTLILGDAGTPGVSIFRYDAVELVALADVELAAVRAAVEGSFDEPSRTRILRRLDTAQVALGRGATYLAMPELNVAARLAEGAPRLGAGDLDVMAELEVVRALQDLIALIGASR